MTTDQTARWIHVLRACRAPRTRLVCVPYAGAGATVFASWILDHDIEVCAVQPPGRQERLRERPVESIDAMADGLLAALDSRGPLPTAIYGHSFGAVLAFEVARRLDELGRSVLSLIVGGREPPHLPRRHPPIGHLTDDELLQAIHARYGTSLALLRNQELMSVVLPALRSDIRALEGYRHRDHAVIDAPITVLRGLRDATTRAEDCAAWGALSRASTTVHEIDAGHFFVDSHRNWVQAHVSKAIREGATHPSRVA